MDEDLSIPGSFPPGGHHDIPFQSWAAICKDILSGPQDTTTKALFPNRTPSHEANTVRGEKEASSNTTLWAEDAEASTLRKGEATGSDAGDLPHEAPYAQSDEIEAMEQDIRSITSIPGRRRPVIILEQPSPPDFPSGESRANEPLIESQDPTQDRESERPLQFLDGNGRSRTPSPNRESAETGAEAVEVIPLVKRIFVSNRSLAERKGNLGSPFEDSDRLLADYLHSRSQSRHQSELSSNESSVANLFTVPRGSVRQQPVESPEEQRSRSVPLPQIQVEQNEDTPKSDTISSEPDNGSKQSSGAGISGTKPRRTSHSYGRAICRSELPDLREDRVYSALESDQAQTAYIEKVFLDEGSTSAFETSTAVRPRRRSLVLVNREELAQKLQNIQEKTRDNRLPPLEGGPSLPHTPLALPVQVGSESLFSALTRGRQSSSSHTQRPRMGVPAASDIRRGRTHSMVIRFSTSQDDLQAGFRPRQADDELAVEKIAEGDETSRARRASLPRKVGLKEKVKEFMSAEARKNRAKPKGSRENRKDPNG